MTDEQLLLAYSQGINEALGELYQRYFERLTGYVRKYLRSDRATAEDITQQTFMTVQTKLHTFCWGHRVGPWLYTIAGTHACLHLRIRKRQRRRDTQWRAPHARHHRGPDSLAVLREDLLYVRSQMHRLTEAEKVLIDSMFFEGRTYRETAGVLGIPEGTVKSRLARTIARLRPRELKLVG